MQPMDEFLQSVEKRLRCPAERRPSVMEELRTHLADQAEALARQGRSKMEAEQQAVREMLPAWLLAVRLSIANGWNVKVQALRELWALGLGIESFVLAAAPLGLIRLLQTNMFRGHVLPGLKDSAVIAGLLVGFLISFAAVLTFGFSLGRIVRGWLWALGIGALGIVTVVLNLRYEGLWGGLTLLVVAMVIAASFLGQRKQSPRLIWLAWASAGLLALCLVGVYLASTGGDMVSALRKMPDTFPASTWPVAMLPWLFWLGAWVLERAGRTQSARLAE